MGKQYNQIEKNRRCQLGLHNYAIYTYENFKRIICIECKYIPTSEPLCYVHEEEEKKEAVTKDTFKNVGHECRDGTINYNKTWD